MDIRIKWVDRWRGILILLVVMGHVVGELFHYASANSLNKYDLWHRVIYSFHMPAFFFLAGLLWSTDNLNISTYIKKKFKRLMIPYFIWGIVSAIIYIVFSGFVATIFSGAVSSAYVGKGEESWWLPLLSIVHAGGWPNGHGFQCNSVLWFLPVLFSVEIFFYFMDRWLNWKLLDIIIAITCIPIHFFFAQKLPLLPLGINNICNYLVYFCVGHSLCHFLNRCNMDHSTWRTLLIGAAILVVYTFTCYIMPNRSIVRYSFLWHVLFCLLAFGGIALSIIFAAGIKSIWLEKLGVASLAIMLSHKFILIFLLNLIPLAVTVKSLPFCVSACMCVIVTVITLCGSYLIYLVLSRITPLAIGVKSAK